MIFEGKWLSGEWRGYVVIVVIIPREEEVEEIEYEELQNNEDGFWWESVMTRQINIMIACEKGECRQKTKTTVRVLPG